MITLYNQRVSEASSVLATNTPIIVRAGVIIICTMHGTYCNPHDRKSVLWSHIFILYTHCYDDMQGDSLLLQCFYRTTGIDDVTLVS